MSLSKLFRPIISLLLLASTASAIDQQYVAFFSAETETYRRIVLDGISDRRIEVTQDEDDQVIINIWGVQKQDYVGRRSYDQGYLVPVKMKIDFPRRSLMTITVSGNVFADIVRYELVEPALYVIDLYPQPLDQESIFHEKSIAALWPDGRFQPDIGAGTVTDEVAPASIVGTQRLGIRRALAWELTPYIPILKRALKWAAFASLFLAGLGILYMTKRKRHIPEIIAPRPAAQSYEHAQEIMKKHSNLSFDEASLLAELESEQSHARA